MGAFYYSLVGCVGARNKWVMGGDVDDPTNVCCYACKVWRESKEVAGKARGEATRRSGELGVMEGFR